MTEHSFGCLSDQEAMGLHDLSKAEVYQKTKGVAMFEKEAEEYYYKNYPVTLNIGEEERKKKVTDIFIKGAEFGYNKANEWHYVKDGDLPKETNEFYVYSKEWGVEIRKFFADVGYFECRKDIVIAWKEIVLPELKESE